MRDAVALSGLVMIGVGCWLVAPWLAFVAVGGVLLMASICGVLRDDPGKTAGQ